MTQDNTKQGILLFAHGSRNPAWAREFETLRDAVKKSAPQTLVELCYLELCEPGFAAGVDALVAAGAEHIEVVPIFLAPGKHTMEDLPALIEIAQRAHADVTFNARATLLEDEVMRAAIARAVTA
jgi:sirohydrochlorin cobaltochelatase